MAAMTSTDNRSPRVRRSGRQTARPAARAIRDTALASSFRVRLGKAMAGVGWGLLCAAVVASALQRVQLTHEHRGLHAQLGRVQEQHDELMIEHSRLMLERGNESAFENIERAATTRLGMSFPEQVEQLLE